MPESMSSESLPPGVRGPGILQNDPGFHDLSFP